MSLVEAARFSNSLDAGVARGRLEAEGLHCVLFDEGFSSAEGVGSFIPVRLMVLDEDLDAARGLLPQPEPVAQSPVRLRARKRAWIAMLLLFSPILVLPILFWLA